jgi:hypothetical protein
MESCPCVSYIVTSRHRRHTGFIDIQDDTTTPNPNTTDDVRKTNPMSRKSRSWSHPVCVRNRRPFGLRGERHSQTHAHAGPFYRMMCRLNQKIGRTCCQFVQAHTDAVAEANRQREEPGTRTRRVTLPLGSKTEPERSYNRTGYTVTRTSKLNKCKWTARKSRTYQARTA